VDAALAMRERLPAIHAELARHGWPPLELNIGINTGTMVVGDMGSRHRRAYTVLGDAVNLAARLQSLCSQHGLGLVVGDATRQALDDRLCLALGHVPVRGRDARVRVWQPLPWRAGENRDADRIERAWQRMRQAMESGHAAEAGALLDELSANHAVHALCRWQRKRLQGEAGMDLAAAPATALFRPQV
jgi:adenylate cyclase